MVTENLIEELHQAVTALDQDLAEKVCRTILAEGLDPEIALTDGAIRGMQEVGTLYENNEYALPELMLSIVVMDTIKEILEPEIIKKNKNVERKGTILMGTVLHDIHDIGKKIVSAMLKSVGWEVIDIGNNVSSVKFVEKAKEIKPDLIGMSALLTTTIPNAKTTVEALREAGISTKVIFGGAPVTKNYTDSIGAYYAENAGEACRVCSSLISERVE